MFTSRDQIIKLLEELGERLDRRGIAIELYLVGGAAMLLGFDRLAVTHDLDARISPTGVIDEIVAEMASEHSDLPPNWLNDAVVPLLPRLDDARRWEALRVPGITVSVASAEHLLAMKVRAGRGVRDLQDIGVLCDILEFTRRQEVWQLCDQIWGEDMIRPEIRAEVDEFLTSRGMS